MKPDNGHPGGRALRVAGMLAFTIAIAVGGFGARRTRTTTTPT